MTERKTYMADDDKQRLGRVEADVHDMSSALIEQGKDISSLTAHMSALTKVVTELTGKIDTLAGRRPNLTAIGGVAISMAMLVLAIGALAINPLREEIEDQHNIDQAMIERSLEEAQMLGALTERDRLNETRLQNLGERVQMLERLLMMRSP